MWFLFKSVNSEHIIRSTACEITLTWMPQDTYDDKLILADWIYLGNLDYSSVINILSQPMYNLQWNLSVATTSLQCNKIYYLWFIQ